MSNGVWVLKNGHGWVWLPVGLVKVEPKPKPKWWERRQ
jgi:hypothetical protein